jgi:hypothetical protein
METRIQEREPRAQPATSGTTLSGIGSALLIAFFFMPWFTACNVEVSGFDLAMQKSPDGQSLAFLLLGIPIVGLIGVILALSNLNSPLKSVGQKAGFILLLAFYPLVSIGLLYMSFRGSQPEAMLARAIIKFQFGFYGTGLAALAMIIGAVLDLAIGKGTSPAPQPPPASAPISTASPPPERMASPPPPPVPPAHQFQPPPTPQPQVWLMGRNGAWARQQLAIKGEMLTIGRHQSNELRLADKAVSRRHAVIRHGHGRYFIQDQGSTIGTYVNGQPVDACELKEGDVVRIGENEFQFHISR